MIRFVTAGESHGQALIAWISGVPAGVPVDMEYIRRELHRRQLGYGRGGRQKIERDSAEALSGIRHGRTIGAPIALRIENRDWANWEKALPVEEIAGGEDAQRKLTAPRPGHADLAGALKFDCTMPAIFWNALPRARRRRAWRQARSRKCFWRSSRWNC